MDKDECIRGFINYQYVKLKRVAAVGGLIILVINLAFNVYPYVSHRLIFSNIYLGIFLLFILIFFSLLILAHLYVVKVEMYRTEAKADAVLSPYNIYAFTPKDELFLRFFYLPTLEGIYSSLKNTTDKEDMKKVIDTVKFWRDSGYIPKEHFPVELKEWYKTKKERRL